MAESAAFNGFNSLTGWETYASRNQDDRTTAPLARQGMTPPKHLSCALYIPRHDGSTSQITLVALGLMQKPGSNGSNGASVAYDVTFREQGQGVVGLVQCQGLTAQEPAEVELAIASAEDTAGILTCKESATAGPAATETRVSISYPDPPSPTSNVPHQAPLPYFRVAAESSTWEWQTHPHHHGRLRYTLVQLPAESQSADARREEILAIYNHVGVAASVSLPYSEGVLLLPPREDPRMETMVVASLLAMLWRLRGLSGAEGKRGARVTESMKKRVRSLKGLLGRKA